MSFFGKTVKKEEKESPQFILVQREFKISIPSEIESFYAYRIICEDILSIFPVKLYANQC